MDSSRPMMNGVSRAVTRHERIWAIYPSQVISFNSLFRALAEQIPVRSVAAARWSSLMSRDPRPLHPTTWLPTPPWGAAIRPGHANYLRKRARAAHTVIFTRPDQAVLLAAFPDAQRIYFANDDYRHYGRSWDEEEDRLLRNVHGIVAISEGLLELLLRRGGRSRDIGTVIPNAIKAHFVPPSCPSSPAEFPDGLKLKRPVAGILGRISSRLRLDWLVDAVEATPWLNWLFVGHVEVEELRDADRPLLERLQAHPRCKFVGQRPPDSLPHYAAALDVAVLPLSESSLNPLASPRRLYLHLPYYAPVVASVGCEQLDEFGQWMTICDGPQALIDTLQRLRADGFDDGLRQARWREAALHTWPQRAKQLRKYLEQEAVLPNH